MRPAPLLVGSCLLGCADQAGPAANAPVTIDKARLVGPSPDVPHVLADCDALGQMRLELDPAQAVVDPDGDPIFSYWLVNYATRPNQPPAQDDVRKAAPLALPFVVDACADREIVPGRINTVELVVRDRPPADELSGTGVHDLLAGSAAALDSAVWFIQVDSTACCGVTP
ncbi:MAG: hypothetical protein U1F43_32800 [Myxococcota bacterium]